MSVTGEEYKAQMEELAKPPSWLVPAKRRRSGVIGGLLAALAFLATKIAVLFKVLVVVLKFGFVKTLVTLLISYGAYALYLGPWSAAGLVAMILVHEMGHVVEIRHQGMKATAPIFIPFMGAAIFQRSHPTTAYRQGLIGIAGPVSGTLGAALMAVAYTSTHWEPLLLAAWWGFLINLINLIPVGMLDGGWIMGAVSKWAYVAGIALLAGMVLFFHLISPLLILIVVLSLPMMIGRFRNAADPYYATVTGRQRWALFGGWLGLVLFLGWGSLWATNLLAVVKAVH
jgi:Zn-dependent protease